MDIQRDKDDRKKKDIVHIQRNTSEKTTAKTYCEKERHIMLHIHIQFGK